MYLQSNDEVCLKIQKSISAQCKQRCISRCIHNTLIKSRAFKIQCRNACVKQERRYIEFVFEILECKSIQLNKVDLEKCILMKRVILCFPDNKDARSRHCGTLGFFFGFFFSWAEIGRNREKKIKESDERVWVLQRYYVSDIKLQVVFQFLSEVTCPKLFHFLLEPNDQELDQLECGGPLILHPCFSLILTSQSLCPFWACPQSFAWMRDILETFLASHCARRCCHDICHWNSQRVSLDTGDFGPN